MTGARTIRDVVVVGVGGQGILLATDIIAAAFLAAGMDVKKSEVHGMAQRGGSVESHVRASPEAVFSPLVSPGEADALIAFEGMEALRYAHFLAPNGILIYSTERIPTVAMATGEARYPSNIGEDLATRPFASLGIDARRHALELGNPRVANTVLLGALSAFADLPAATWEECVMQRVPPKAAAVNERALARGRSLAAAAGAEK